MGRRGIFLATLLVAQPLLAKQPPTDAPERSPDPPGTAQLSHPSPGQTRAPPLPPPLVGVAPYAQLPAIDESQWVVVGVHREPYWRFGAIDPVLTEACRLGDFASLALNRIVLQFSGTEGRALARVVPPLYRHLLIDRRRLARPNVTYYFFGSGWADCEVRVDTGVARGTLAAGRGTALPPADPTALARRKALIASWPKSTGR